MDGKRFESQVKRAKGGGDLAEFVVRLMPSASKVEVAGTKNVREYIANTNWSKLRNMIGTKKTYEVIFSFPP